MEPHNINILTEMDIIAFTTWRIMAYCHMMLWDKVKDLQGSSEKPGLNMKQLERRKRQKEVWKNQKSKLKKKKGLNQRLKVLIIIFLVLISTYHCLCKAIIGMSLTLSCHVI